MFSGSKIEYCHSAMGKHCSKPLGPITSVKPVGGVPRRRTFIEGVSLKWSILEDLEHFPLICRRFGAYFPVFSCILETFSRDFQKDL